MPCRNRPSRPPAPLCEVRDAEEKNHAQVALKRFVKDYEAKWPKATERVVKNADALSRPNTGASQTTIESATCARQGDGGRAAGGHGLKSMHRRSSPSFEPVSSSKKV